MSKPEFYHNGLAYYADSPDAGDNCLCSWCAQPIYDLPIRLWYAEEKALDGKTAPAPATHETWPWLYIASLHIACLFEWQIVPGMTEDYVALGTPLYWMDEEGGLLAKAVNIFLAERKRMVRSQAELLRRYLEYYINAPCWLPDGIESGHKEKIEALRDSIKGAIDKTKLRAWIAQALEIGLDPL